MGKARVLSVAVVLSCAAAGARATSYTASILPVTGGSATYSDAQAYGVATGTAGGFATATADGNIHALVWNTSTSSFVDLNLPTNTMSFVNGVTPAAQAGFATVSNIERATVWYGTAGSEFQLPDSGYDSSAATGIFAAGATNYVVGFGSKPPQDNTHAVLWTGSGTSYAAQDLQPSDPTYVSSFARATDGVTIVGAASDSSNVQQAALWKISAPTSSFQLLAGGFDSSVAWGVSGDQIVGSGDTPDGTHAMLWINSGNTVIDLQGSGLSGDSSFADATNGVNQVGQLTGVLGDSVPYIWSGSAASGVALPVPFASTGGEAFGIDAAGDIVGHAVDSAGVDHALLWTPVAAPEPGTMVMMGLGVLSLLKRKSVKG